MSRSGWTEVEFDSEEDVLSYGRTRARVASAIRGKRGQAFLKELLAVLEAMPEKKLIDSELQTAQGDVCAMGAVMKARGIDMTDIDIEDYESIGDLVGINHHLVSEIEWENDHAGWRLMFVPERLEPSPYLRRTDEKAHEGRFDTRSYFCPFERYKAMVKWVKARIHAPEEVTSA